MKRWEVTYLGKPFMLYCNTADEVREKYVDTMDKGSDVEPLPYSKELYDKLTSLPVKHIDKQGREYREINCGAGYCVYRMSKDEQDGQYYDLIQYRRSGGRLIEPCLWNSCTAQEFADVWLKEIPVRQCGFVASLNDVKKLCGKVWLRLGKCQVWRDSDGYFYVGFSPNWRKTLKEEYKRMSPHRDTAVYVCWTEGIYCNSKRGWFESEEIWHEYWNKILSEQPSWAGSLRYKIAKRGYASIPVEDRKLICRLSYMDIERELKFESPEFVAMIWSRKCDWLGVDDMICKKIVEEIARRNSV